MSHRVGVERDGSSGIRSSQRLSFCLIDEETPSLALPASPASLFFCSPHRCYLPLQWLSPVCRRWCPGSRGPEQYTAEVQGHDEPEAAFFDRHVESEMIGIQPRAGLEMVWSSGCLVSLVPKLVLRKPHQSLRNKIGGNEWKALASSISHRLYFRNYPAIPRAVVFQEAELQ